MIVLQQTGDRVNRRIIIISDENHKSSIILLLSDKNRAINTPYKSKANSGMYAMPACTLYIKDPLFSRGWLVS